MPVMRCPPRARACVAEKSPLTNRIRRHFARIKAVRADRGQSWLLRQIKSQTASGGAPDISKTKVRTFRRRKSGHFEDESQDISETKVRTFRRRKSGHFGDESQETS